MKAKLNSWLNILLTSLLGLMGYGCVPMVKYGVPTGDLKLEGKVSNENNEPLQNIQVIHRQGWKDGAGTMCWREYQDTLYTNSNGMFYRQYKSEIPTQYIKIIVHDTAGVYASDSIETSVRFSGGDGDLYQGQAELKADFVLKKKQY